MRSRLHLRLVAGLIAVAFVVAGCGSDDSDNADDTSSSDVTTEVDSDASADSDASSDDDGAASSGPDDEADEQADGGDEATSAVVDGPGSDDFCRLYAQNQRLVNEFDFFDPAQVEQWIDTSIGLLDEAIADAPGEIRADLAIIRADFTDLADLLEEYDYDFFAAADSVGDTSPASEAASDRLDAYVESVCGIDPDAADASLVDGLFDEDSIEALLGNETLFNEIIGGMTADGEMTEEQATCLLSNLDGELISGLMSGDPATAMSDPQILQDLIGTFTACGIEFG